ncbi:unnamed protein product [Urochloa humidicola]
MAEKISMIIVVVDLDCHKCYNKIRKVLCQLQDCEKIRTISFDDKSKTITIVGPFDPQRLACKLRCKGGKVIKSIHIVDPSAAGMTPPPKMVDPPPASPPPPVKPCKKKHKHPPPPPPVADDPPPPPQPQLAPAPPPEPEMPPPPSPSHHAPPPDHREMTSTMVPAFVEEKHSNSKPAELEPPPMSPPRKPPPMEMPPMPMPRPASPLPPPPAKERPVPPPCRPVDAAPAAMAEYVIPTVEIPSWPAPPVGPCGCPCCAPCYQGYYEGCRCYCCGGRGYMPAIPAACGGGGYRGCRTFSDEDPTAACSVM